MRARQLLSDRADAAWCRAAASAHDADRAERSSRRTSTSQLCSSRASAAGARTWCSAKPRRPSSVRGKRLALQSWFRHSGALSEDLIPPLGHHLRLVVAGGTIIGAAKRIAQPGEWRTNVAPSARPQSPVPAARSASELALPRPRRGLGPRTWSVSTFCRRVPEASCAIELNGAVDFRPVYSLPGRSVFDDAVAALAGGRGEAELETVAAGASGARPSRCHRADLGRPRRRQPLPPGALADGDRRDQRGDAGPRRDRR